MSIARPRIPSALTLALGWNLAHGPAPTLQARGGDRSDESILTAGPVMIRYNEGMRIQVPQDALYFLDAHPVFQGAGHPSFDVNFWSLTT